MPRGENILEDWATSVSGNTCSNQDVNHVSAWSDVLYDRNCTCFECRERLRQESVPIKCVICNIDTKRCETRSLDTGSSVIYVCETCFKTKASRCDFCGNYHFNKDSHMLKDKKRLCSRCYREKKYFICVDCNGQFIAGTEKIISDRKRICIKCFSEKYFMCSNCGRPHNLENRQINDDISYCERCFISLFGKLVKNYNYKPQPIFYKEQRESKIFLGVELEIESKSMENIDIAQKLDKFLKKSKISDRFYLKHDGSVQNGFEIVSHPHTLKCHFKLKWKEILDWFNNNNCTSYEDGRCGLHIHVNKDCLTKVGIGKLQYFYWINKDKIRTFSKRKSESEKKWSRFVEIPEEYIGSVIPNEKKYYAVNLRNKNTIEFRIFRGTLYYSRFTASMQFVDSLVRFISRYQIKTMKNRKTKSWDDYMRWLDRRKGYTELKEYLTRVKLRKGDKICVS